MRRTTGMAAMLVAAGLNASLAQHAPKWVRGATCYEIFVRSFSDSDGDGVGDLKGLTAKLDYINDGNPRSDRSLGARCVWLMPIVESPSYHGYDATDYYHVARAYGTNEDFKRFVAAAHQRGIRVLVDMVLNHTSNEHPWFQAAMRDTASRYRNWYRWSTTKPNSKGPWGQEVWYKSPVRDEYYYAVFWSRMPDLNYETPAVRTEVKKIARFWLREMGVDGFRLDAVSFLMEDGGKLAGSVGTHALLHDYASYVRSVKGDAYTVGEVYDSLGTVLTYYPDQLDSYFSFEQADSIIAAVRDGRGRGMLVPALRLQRAVPNDRTSPFLRNHDQPRTRTELGGDMRKARLASFLLLTIPGLPFVYYGEEIGMIGAKPDERLRTPMQWTSGHAGGFTTGTPWEALQDDSSLTNVEAEERDTSSVLAMNRRMIHLRSRVPALGEGTLVPLRSSHDGVTAYLRRKGNSIVLVVANLTTEALEGVTLTSDEGALPAGRWSVLSLIDDRVVRRLTVGATGRVDTYAPARALAPLEGYVFALSRLP
jgi:alpha-amylase